MLIRANALAIMAKAPLAGTVKTRLLPYLSAEEAAELARSLLLDQLSHLCAIEAADLYVAFTPPHEEALMRRLAPASFQLFSQSEGDLGTRMLSAITAANGPALVIGTDCPALTADHLRRAADILCQGTDAVILPAEDGGYVLIGVRAPQAAMFEQMCWGTARVLGETRRRLRRLGLTWQEPVMLWDLDLPADIERLRAIGLSDLVR